jgi:D-alanyl-D-alanine carboxypeptidase/D-alanyl-D-alanine-endopeptidase (penicillin-binding protein 4)
MARLIVFMLCCVWLLPAHARSHASLPRAVVSTLKSVGISPAHVGVVVWEAGKARPRLVHDEKLSFNPASVMKLLTTYAALDLLGPAYTWKTEVYADGPIKQGVLNGNLYIKGYGDPFLTLERIWLLLREIKLLHGIREIHGDVILDASYFKLDPVDPGRFDDDPRRSYNAPPSALLVNFNATILHLAADDGVLTVEADPLPSPLVLENRIHLGSGDCKDWRDQLTVEYQPTPNPPRLVLGGDYPQSCGEKTTSINLGDPLETAAGLFRTLWAELGGKLDGKVRPGQVPDNARLIEQFDSPPLADILRSINKWSNNVMARQVFLTLGAAKEGPPATLDKSVSVMHDWLKSKGIDASGIVLENGSGLSRIERVRPINLAKLLQQAWRSPSFSELESSLPIVAVDGTMKERGENDGVAGHAHLKTGTLSNAKNLAGYVFDKRGRRWIVVFLINDLHAESGAAAQDALLEWVYQGMPGKPFKASTR